jgi:glutamyl-tRNA(Gln) amidotransferase subunit E
MKAWGIPEDTYTYIFSKDHFPLIERIINELEINAKFVGTFFGHSLKHAEGQYTGADILYGKKLYKLFDFLKKEKLDLHLAKTMLPIMLEYPKMDFNSILNELNFKRVKAKDILSEIPILVEKFQSIKPGKDEADKTNWVMGQLRNLAMGNINLSELSKKI